MEMPPIFCYYLYLGLLSGDLSLLSFFPLLPLLHGFELDPVELLVDVQDSLLPAAQLVLFVYFGCLDLLECSGDVRELAFPQLLQLFLLYKLILELEGQLDLGDRVG